MMDKQSRRRRGEGNGIKFVLYPIAFSLLTIILFAVILGPSIKPSLDISSLIFSSEVPKFDEAEVNIFQGSSPQSSAVIKYKDIKIPAEGDKFGNLSISSVKIDAPLVYGDGPKQLKKGIGCYTGTYLPGQGRTILLAAHNNSYFRNLKNAKKGDVVQIKTHYGEYKYEITGSKNARHDDTSAYDLTANKENLIMYTCDESLVVGATPYRLFVYAKFISGPSLEY